MKDERLKMKNKKEKIL